MQSKARQEKAVRKELSEVSLEIKKRISRLDKLSEELEQGFGDLEKNLNEKYALIQPKINDPEMKGVKAWDYVWGIVLDTVEGMGIKVKTGPNINQKALKETLQARQTSLKGEHDVASMSGREVWSVVWNGVWNDLWTSIDKFHNQASEEINKLNDELQELLAKQGELRKKQQDLHHSLEGSFNAVRGMFDNMFKSKPKA